MAVRASFVSKNAHKARELAVLLPGWEIEPTRADELPEEVGGTFYENARAKALFGREVDPADRWAIGEDSGLEVDGLGGRPGIRSARYAGPGATDEENVAKLLQELAGTSGAARRARYVSELVCLTPAGEELRGTGTLEGSIAEAPRGTEGFGYDPVFVPAGESRTVAELGDRWKAARSHRAAAARDLLQAVGSSASGL
ncbi:MAG TPA: non-canonical purine NTP pyrophosphatase [Gaiellaceae bacterium]|nr:non-canonical purine NTP pyrophosphatase [Gaiellaceae bacterium]